MKLLLGHEKKEYFLSKIDARIKLAVSLALIIMVLSYDGIVFPVLIAFIGFILCKAMKVPIKVFLLRLSEPFFIAFVVVMLKFLFIGKIAMFSFEIFGIKIIGHSDGLMDGIIIASRILGSVSIVAVLAFSTSFIEIVSGLSWFKIPKGFIDILIFTHRYILILFEDSMVIYCAQKNRLGYSNIRRGLRSFGTLAGTLIIKAFDQSQSITTAMVQRGYNGNIPMLKHKPFKSSEIIASLLLITTGVLIWII
jgi:cobalt/nickel transport system permease protein